MKLFFAGTCGEIEEQTIRHKYHSSLIVKENGSSFLIDLGTKHSETLYDKINEFDGILVTHAHPDHYLWTIVPDGSISIPVYLTGITLSYGKNKPANYRLINPGKTFEIGHFKITAFDVIHSIRCPAVCFKIKGSQKQLVYAPDIVDTGQPKEIVFNDTDILVADGSSFDINLVRKRDGKLFGHATIKTIINWCRKYGIKKLIITHCGKQIVGGNEEEISGKILDFANGEISVDIAFDGMEIEV
jgi:ribonuclease BN (tRNA processing enzyme)